MAIGLTVLAAMFALAGCGGDPAADAAAGAAPTDPAAAAAPGATVNGGDTVPGGTTGASMADEEGMNEISKASASNGQPLKLSARTPKAFAAAHCARPIMVVLHQPGAIVDQALLREATTASKQVKDDLLLKYTPKDVRTYGDLPTKLGLFSTPGLAIVSRDGTLENFWSGEFIDNELIARSLRNAARAIACKEADAAAAGQAPAGSALSDAAGLVAGTKKPAAATTGLAGASAAGAAGALPTGAATTPGAIDPATGMPAATGTAGMPATATTPAVSTTPGATTPMG